MKIPANHYFPSKLASLLFISQCVILAFIHLVFSSHIALGLILEPLLLVGLATPAIYEWILKPLQRERERLQDKINHLALHDNLTRLANRRLLVNEIIKLQSSLIRHYYYAAIIYLDLNHFKTINSQYGHESGDRILIEIGQRLISTFRLEDIVSRISDDEFVIILTHIGDDFEQAEKRSIIAAQRMLQEIERPYNIGLDSIKIKAKMGVTIITPEKCDPEVIIENANEKMKRYQEKNL